MDTIDWELTSTDLCNIFCKRLFQQLSDLCIFFHEFRWKVIVISNHVCINQQLSICKRACADTKNRDTQLVRDQLTNDFRHTFHKDRARASLLNTKRLFQESLRCLRALSLCFIAAHLCGKLRCQANMSKNQNTNIRDKLV